MKTIIVPTDFSENAEYALDFALEIADTTKSTVLLLHVIDLPSIIDTLYLEASAMDEIYFQSKKMAEYKLQEIRAEHNNKNLQTLVLRGNIITVIKDIEKQYNAQLIVMGTTGSTGLKEVIVGSNTEKVVRNAYTPVLSIPGPVKLSGLKHVSIPTNGKDSHPEFFSLIQSLQQELHFNIDILYINTVHAIKNEAEVKKGLDKYAQNAGMENYTVTVIRGITPEDGIADFIDINKVDMVAIMTHGRQGFNHLIFGSLAESLVNHLNVPVLTFNLRTHN